MALKNMKLMVSFVEVWSGVRSAGNPRRVEAIQVAPWPEHSSILGVMRAYLLFVGWEVSD